MTPRRRTCIPLLAALSLLLGACASPVSSSQESPAPEPSSPAESPAVEPPALDCGIIADSVLAGLGLQLVDRLGDPSPVIAAEEGGLHCHAAPGAGTTSEIVHAVVAIVPGALASGAAELTERCGVTWGVDDGCTDRIVMSDVVADVVVLGPPSASRVAMLDELTLGVTALLEGGARPAEASGNEAAGVDCQALDMSTAALPADIGVFGEWGGTDQNSPSSQLISLASIARGARVGCIAFVDGGYVVGLSSVPADPALLGEPGVIGTGDELELPSGRAAIVRVESPEVGREFVRIVTAADGVLLLMTVGTLETMSPTVPLVDAAPILADAVALAVEAGRP